MPVPDSSRRDISAALVCLNEAHHLRRSLPRLDFCDEILVVDLGSEDDSMAVARAHGARVVAHEWVPFREIIIRELLRQVRHDWVLMTDPDLLFPTGVGERLRRLLDEARDPALGMVYFPMVTCFDGRPLRHGQKAGRRAYRAVVHRGRVSLTDLLHHKGVALRPGFSSACLVPPKGVGDIHHYWIGGWSDAMSKARRYLPHEGRTRAALGQTFSWRGALRETLWSLWLDLRKGAFLDRQAAQVMIFQLWYTCQAHLALRRFKREKG